METIKKQVETLKQIFGLLEELFIIIKRNPYFFGLLLTLCIGYYATRFLVYSMPKSTINIFFSSINEKKYEKAWKQLSTKYQSSTFNDDVNTFREGYTTTSHIGNLNILYKKEQMNPFADFFKREISYHTYYEVVDIIPKGKLSKRGIRAWNSFWVEINEEKSIDELLKRSVGQFKIKRSFRQSIKLIKEDNRWKISRVDLEEIGLIQ